MSGPEVFVSYNHGSKVQVRNLKGRLESEGFTVWLDEAEMGGGDALYGSIDQGIRNCRVVVSCMSPKYCQSENCQREVALADVIKKPIVPVILEKVPWPPEGDMSLRMCKLLYVDFTKADKTGEVISQIKKYASSHTEDKKVKADEGGLTSGRWCGHFIDQRSGGKKWPIDFYITFSNGGRAFIAQGLDEIGKFDFKNGRINGTSVSYEKSYSTHSIMYEGELDHASKTITGMWRHPNCSEYGGSFRMEPMSI